MTQRDRFRRPRRSACRNDVSRVGRRVDRDRLPVSFRLTDFFPEPTATRARWQCPMPCSAVTRPQISELLQRRQVLPNRDQQRTYVRIVVTDQVRKHVQTNDMPAIGRPQQLANFVGHHQRADRDPDRTGPPNRVGRNDVLRNVRQQDPNTITRTYAEPLQHRRSTLGVAIQVSIRPAQIAVLHRRTFRQGERRMLQQSKRGESLVVVDPLDGCRQDAGNVHRIGRRCRWLMSSQ